MSDTWAPVRIVVLGCGNPSRGDDALGPKLMARVEAWLQAHPGRAVEAFQDFQLQVEHTLDLEGRDLVLFVDATASGPDPYTFRRVAPAPGLSGTTHALSPEGLLQAYGALGCGAPPPAYVLAVRGHAFQLGTELSPQAGRNAEAAWQRLAWLLEHPSPACWDGLALERLSASGPLQPLISASRTASSH